MRFLGFKTLFLVLFCSTSIKVSMGVNFSLLSDVSENVVGAIENNNFEYINNKFLEEFKNAAHLGEEETPFLQPTLTGLSNIKKDLETIRKFNNKLIKSDKEDSISKIEDTSTDSDERSISNSVVYNFVKEIEKFGFSQDEKLASKEFCAMVHMLGSVASKL